MCSGISIMGLCMVTVGLAAIYGIATLAPKLSLQNMTKAVKAKMKGLMLAHNKHTFS